MGNGKLEAAKKKSNRRKGLTFAQQAGIVLGSGTLVATAIGAYLVITYANSSAPAPNMAAASLRDNTGSIIARSANGDGCHRKKFDNVTGTITDDGPTSCEAVDSAPSSTAASGRFGAIASGFRH
jgi:hypothetical protein